jgi:hypothetical protein
VAAATPAHRSWRVGFPGDVNLRSSAAAELVCDITAAPRAVPPPGVRCRGDRRVAHGTTAVTPAGRRPGRAHRAQPRSSVQPPQWPSDPCRVPGTRTAMT